MGWWDYNNYYGTITNCYSTGSVSGNKWVGGLVGVNNYYGTITNCYSTGSVSGKYNVGGLVGRMDGTITRITTLVISTIATQLARLQEVLTSVDWSVFI